MRGNTGKVEQLQLPLLHNFPKMPSEITESSAVTTKDVLGHIAVHP